MCSKKDKYIWISRIKEQVYAVYNARQKEYTIIEKMEVSRYSKRLSYTKKDTNQSSIEKYAWAHVDWLLKGDIFWGFYF